MILWNQVIEDADQVLAEWQVPKESNLTRSPLAEAPHTSVVSFETSLRYESAIVLTMDHVLDLVLGIDLNLKMNSSFSVTVQNRETQKEYHLHYIVADLMINVQDDNFYYGISGNGTQWKHLTRDILVDLQKGLQLSDKKKKYRRTEIKVTIHFVYTKESSAIKLTFFRSPRFNCWAAVASTIWHWPPMSIWLSFTMPPNGLCATRTRKPVAGQIQSSVNCPSSMN